MQRRSKCVDAARLMYWSAVHTVCESHTRLDVTVGATVSYSVAVHTRVLSAYVACGLGWYSSKPSTFLHTAAPSSSWYVPGGHSKQRPGVRPLSTSPGFSPPKAALARPATHL
jgi:hypothetical protein